VQLENNVADRLGEL